MNRTLLTVISLVAGCCLQGTTFAQEDESIEIRTIGIPPYGIQNNTGSNGIYYDIANLLAQDAGYRANNHIYPYARIVNELKTGQTDMTIMFKYAELEGHVDYVAPLPSLKTVVIGLKGSTFDSVSSLKGRTLAYLRGAKFSDEIDNDPEIFKHVTDDFEQGMKMLMFGRVDAIIGPMDPIFRAVEGTEKGRTVFGEPLVVAERTPWVQISKKSTKSLSVNKLKIIFDNMLKRGELSALRKKYGIGDE